MKNLPETQPSVTTLPFDRTSTREELFEVIEMLCASGRVPWTTQVAGTAVLGADFTRDETSDDDAPSLEELILGNHERLN